MTDANTPLLITADEGTALGAAYLASLSKCFAANDFTSQYEMMADTVGWDWSGGVVGTGPKADYYKVLEGSWQAIVSSFNPTNAFIVVDGQQGKIIVTFDIVLIMDGRGAVPITQDQVFTGKNMFELTVDADHKITNFRGIWDPVDPAMAKAMGAVLTAFGKK